MTTIFSLTCIIVNLVAGILFIIGDNKKQDAAGRHLMTMYGIIGLLLGGLGFLLYYYNHPYWSLVITLAPAIIICGIAIRIIKER